MPVNSNSHLFIKIWPNSHLFQGYQSVNKRRKFTLTVQKYITLDCWGSLCPR